MWILKSGAEEAETSVYDFVLTENFARKLATLLQSPDCRGLIEHCIEGVEVDVSRESRNRQILCFRTVEKIDTFRGKLVFKIF